MVATLTRDDHVRRVLDVYKEFKSEPGKVLKADNFVAIAARRNWDIRQLSEGLKLAQVKGWVEELPTGGIRLTQEGFRVL